MFDYDRAVRLNRKKLWMNVPWSIGVCPDGKTCWCRTIITNDLQDQWREIPAPMEIVNPGNLSRQKADMVIHRHNIYIRRRRVLLEKTMKQE